MIEKKLLCAVLALVLGSGVAAAHEGSHDAGPAKGTADRVLASKPKPQALNEEERARRYFTDLPVYTHKGQKLRFYSDVLRGRTVLVNLFYTSCKDACPLINQHLAYVQKLMGDRMGRDVFFVSITVDPDTDTVAALDKYRKNFKAGEGWLFLTGQKKDIDVVTRKLGQVYAKEEHVSWLLLGNVKTGHWQKLRPNMPQTAIAYKLRALADETAAVRK